MDAADDSHPDVPFRGSGRTREAPAARFELTSQRLDHVAPPHRACFTPIFGARPQRRRADLIADALGLIGLPAAVLGTSGEVLAANRRFVALLPDLVQVIDRRPRLADPDADRLINDPVTRRERFFAGSVRSLPIRDHDGKPAAILQLMGLSEPDGDVYVGAAILTITPVRPRPAPSTQLLQRLFGLSPAEARVAKSLAARRTIKVIADDFGVSRETVRSQVKTVFAKTGTKRQLDLAVLLAGLPLLDD